ncbi:MAG: hypothetical protein ACK4VI_08930 [Alphaproteobacteria bacterium]
MKTKSFFKLALVGTTALMFMASDAMAQAITFEAGVPQTIDITANVDNSITATVTDPSFDRLGVVASTTPGERAVALLNFDGTLTLTPAGSARIISGGTPVAGIVGIDTGDAFATTPVYVTLSDAVDLTTGTVGNPALRLVRVATNQAGGVACGALTGAILDVLIPANTVQGCDITNADGELTFNIGATIRTVDGADPRPVYETGLYEGSFDMIMEY